MRIAELDGLRGLAALAVVVFHLSHESFYAGWAGVDVFFVLSGFLITGICLGGRPDWRWFRAFYWRRGLRIWPIYYVFVGGCFAVGIVTWANGWWYPFYFQNFPLYRYASAYRFVPNVPALNHTWTLAMEEQFYFLWPALVVFAGRRAVVPLAIMLWSVSVALRASGWSSFVLLSHLDGFAAGAILAVLASSEHGRAVIPRLSAIAGIAAVVLFVVLATRTPRPMEALNTGMALEISVAVLASLAIIGPVVLHSGHRRFAALRWPPLVYLGVISYGIYLYHWPILLLVRHLTPSIPGLWRAPGLIVLAATLAVSAASWRWIEQWFLKWKKYFPYGEGPRSSHSP